MTPNDKTTPAAPPADDARVAEIRNRVNAAVGNAPDQVKAALVAMLLARAPDSVVATTAGRIGAQLGNISELTVMAPLKPGGANHLRGLFALLQGNFQGAKQVGTLHDMRFVFLENDTRMLFATTYDGDWDVYIGDFATKIPDLMDLIFSAVEGWPGIRSPTVKDFIASIQVQAAGWFVAYPNISVADILRMKKTDVALNEFLDKIS